MGKELFDDVQSKIGDLLSDVKKRKSGASGSATSLCMER